MKQVALITGASSGIGLECARVFAREGFNLVLIARSQQRLVALQEELTQAYKTKSWIIIKDLSQKGAAEGINSILLSEHISIDVLVNNAGLGDYGPFNENNVKRLEEMIMVNIFSLTLLTRLLFPSMIQRKKGKILMIASIAGFYPGPSMAAYFASKAYVLSLSESLREEVREYGITVTALCPGPTKTAFYGDEDISLSGYMDAKRVAELGYKALMKGKRIEITGVKNKCLVFIGSLLPRFLRPQAVQKLLQ